MSNIKINNLIEEIKQLKKEKNAIILTHYYQKLPMHDIADFIGDSLGLSKQAASTDAEIIIFCGVYFMAETAKIICPEKTVLLPNMNSGCQMVDMMNVEDLKEFKEEHPGLPVVCYINSTADVKAESDICCTSSNGVEVVKSLPNEKVLFVPDQGLGSYIGRQLPDKEVICYDGMCPPHYLIDPDKLKQLRAEYPEAAFLIHPECEETVINMADFVGSTTAIAQYAEACSHRDVVIGSEIGFYNYLKRKLVDKNVILASNTSICPNMKQNNLEDVLEVLTTYKNQIDVPEDIARRAKTTIDRMLAIQPTPVIMSPKKAVLN